MGDTNGSPLLRKGVKGTAFNFFINLYKESYDYDILFGQVYYLKNNDAYKWISIKSLDKWWLVKADKFSI